MIKQIMLFKILFLFVFSFPNSWAGENTAAQLPGKKNTQTGITRLPGVCYGPFRDNEDPDAGIYPSIESISEDIALVTAFAKAVRTYGTGRVLGDIPGKCQEAKIDCYPGAWISAHRKNNNKEIASLVNICNSGKDRVKAAIVGNEVLLRKEQSVDQMIQYIRQVKSQVKVPVTTAEVWTTWLKHKRLAREVDFLLVHIHPYWDGIAVEDAAEYVVKIWKRLKKTFPEKKIVIGETGWPSAGQAMGDAVPGQKNQGRFLKEFLQAASENDMKYFIFEAFDEKWKEKFEGKIGAHWGIYKSDGSLKKHNRDTIPGKAPKGIQRPPRKIRPRVVSVPIVVYTDWDAEAYAFMPSGSKNPEGCTIFVDEIRLR